MTVYPNIIGSKQTFREDFTSAQAVSDNGGVNNTTSPVAISNGKAVCTGYGIHYPDFNEDNFINGGTIKIKFTLDTATINKTILATGDNSTEGWVLSARDVGGNVRLRFAQIKNGGIIRLSGSTNLTSGQTYTIHLRFDTTTVSGLIVYIDNVAESMSSNENSGTGYIVGTNGLMIGDNVNGSGVGMYITVDTVLFYNGLWTAQEVADDYNNVTYSALDASKALIWLPSRTRFNDGSNEVTENLGTLSNLICGDGSTASTYPTFSPPKEISFDGGDYLKTAGTITTTTSDSFLFHALLSTTDAGTRYIFDLRDGSNEGFAIYKDVTGHIVAFTNDGSLNAVTSSKLINDGVDHDVVVAFNNVSDTRVKVDIHIDGELDISTEVDIWSLITNEIFIAATVGASAGWVGTMKDIGLWRTTGTPRQARYLHQKSLKELNR